MQCNLASTYGWSVIQLPKQDNPKQAQRSLKILQHLHPELTCLKDYDVVIYHDGNNAPLNNQSLLPFVSLMENYDLVCFEHPHRYICMDEVREVVRLGLVHADAYDKVLHVYNENGFNDDIGLTETRVLIRDTKSIIVKEFNELWLHLLSTNNIWRDQTFFDYCIWKTGINFKRFRNINFPFRVIKTQLDPNRIRYVR